MAITTVPNLGPDPFTVNASVLNGKVDPLVTDYNGNIDNDNIATAAAIANSKLNLTTVSQNVTLAGTNVLSGATTLSGVTTVSGVTTMSSKIFKFAKGADVASVAGAITLGEDGNYFDITGTNAITSITAKTAGTVVVLQFDSTASLVDGSNLKLAGNFTGAAESQIMLSSDGTNWFEVSRSPLSTVSAASAAEVTTGAEAGKYIAPSTAIAHHGVCKGWIQFTGDGATINDSYNVSSLTDTGTGDFTVVWDTDFANDDYACVGSCGFNAGTGNNMVIALSSPAVGSIVVRTYNSAPALSDSPGVVSVMAMGDR